MTNNKRITCSKDDITKRIKDRKKRGHSVEHKSN